MSPTAAAAVASSYLKDLIAAGHLPQEMSFLAVDPSKLARARKTAMKESQGKEKERYESEKIIGMRLMPIELNQGVENFAIDKTFLLQSLEGLPKILDHTTVVSISLSITDAAHQAATK